MASTPKGSSYGLSDPGGLAAGVDSVRMGPSAGAVAGEGGCMSLGSWVTRLWRQMRGVHPFGGNYRPTRMRLFGFGRPALPFPHPWNYRDPLRILSTYWHRPDETGPGRDNRYLDVPGLSPVLVTRDPAVIRAVLSDTGDKPGQFDRDTRPAAGIARATGEDSLLYANGETWKRQKRLAARPFRRSNLFQPERFHEFEQTFRKTIRERLEALRARQEATGERVTRIQLEPEIQTVMLEMLVNNFFGGQVGYTELRERYVPAITMLIGHMVVDTIRFRPIALLRRLGGRHRRVEQARRDFEQLTDIALAGRAAGLGLWGQFESDAPDADLRSNIRVFLAGALEATTSFASWAISHLARNPALQDEIHAEVEQIESYDPENLDQAVALNRVLEETLRLTPSLYFLPRRATVDTRVDLPGDRHMVIPRGTHVVLDVWHANRSDVFWGEGVSGHPAGVFAPARWKVLADKPRGADTPLHFGFGHGPRYCPGRYLGLLEVGLVVGAFVRVFRFTAVREELEARAGVSTKPADGVLVDLERRALHG